MGYKTIAVYCDANKNTCQRLTTATELAARFDATMVAVHARPLFEAPAFDVAVNMEPVFESHKQWVAKDEQEALSAFQNATKGKSVKSQWRATDGFAEEVLTTSARYADLVVVGQANDDDIGPTPNDLPETVAIATGRPVLVVPHIGAPKKPGRTVMLCWNASRESARAASEALPFLKAAERVIVLIVDPHRSSWEHGDEPGADVATWLARHGVKVTVMREPAANMDVGDVILSRAADQDVDLIVMGVYGHSRVRELVLGGASRTILASMTVPVLMVH